MSTTIAELDSLVAEKIIDARGTACPGPLLEAKKGMTTVAIGSTIEIWSTDAATKNDISAWSAKVGHDFLGAIEADGYDRVFVIRRK